MEKEIGSVTFTDSIKDTFPFIESSIIKMDNNLSWWKKNYAVLEAEIANQTAGLAKNPIEINTKFTIYSGSDDAVEAVKWNGPAIEFEFIETSPNFVFELKNAMGDSWEGKRLLTDENKLYVLFE